MKKFAERGYWHARWVQVAYSAQRRRHRRLASSLEPCDWPCRGACKRLATATDTWPMAIVTATPIIATAILGVDGYGVGIQGRYRRWLRRRLCWRRLRLRALLMAAYGPTAYWVRRPYWRPYRRGYWGPRFVRSTYQLPFTAHNMRRPFRNRWRPQRPSYRRAYAAEIDETTVRMLAVARPAGRELGSNLGLVRCGDRENGPIFMGST